MANYQFADRPVPVANHLSDFHSIIRRSALIFLAAAALTSIWAESLLSDWARYQVPGGALSIYGPYDWIEMRFTTIALIASVVTIPFLSLDLRSFARPGLSPTERRWLDSFLLLSGLVIPLTLYWAWYELIPYFIYVGLEIDTIAGVSAHYDAAELFALASGLSWILILIFLTTLFLALSRLFGMVASGQSRFRNRTLAICAGTLILTLPATFEGVRILTAVFAAFFADLLSRTTPAGPLGPRISRLSTVVDRDNLPQRAVLLDCSCEGACPSMRDDWIRSAVAKSSATALCLSQDEQRELIDMARLTGLTRLTVTGCDGSPIPRQVKTTLDEYGVKIDGLGWLDNPASESETWRRQSIQMHTSQYQTNESPRD